MNQTVVSRSPDSEAPPAGHGSLAARFWAYLQERFPPGTYALLVAVFYLAAAWLGQVRAGGGAGAEAGVVPLATGLRSLAGALVVLLAFFTLRVFDEEKDSEQDRLAHPERVLSRGLVTLAQLRRAGLVAIVLQGLLAALLGWVPALAWGGVLLFALAMKVEFFCGGVLRRHLVLYALTHNPVVCLLALFAIATGQGGGRLHLDAVLLLFLLLVTGLSLLFEVGRKVRAPEDERAGQDTYSAALGPRGASAFGIASLILAAAAGCLLGRLAGFSGYFQLGLGLLALWCLLTWLSFAASHERRCAKRVAVVTSLTMLAGLLLVALELALAHGIAWSWG